MIFVMFNGDGFMFYVSCWSLESMDSIEYVLTIKCRLSRLLRK